MGNIWRITRGVVLGITLGLLAAHFYNRIGSKSTVVDPVRREQDRHDVKDEGSFLDRLKLGNKGSVPTAAAKVLAAQPVQVPPKLIGCFGARGLVMLCYDDGTRKPAQGHRMGWGMYRLASGEVVIPVIPQRRYSEAKPAPPLEGVSGRGTADKGVALGESRSDGSDDSADDDEPPLYKDRNKSGLLKIRDPGKHLVPPKDPSSS